MSIGTINVSPHQAGLLNLPLSNKESPSVVKKVALGALALLGVALLAHGIAPIILATGMVKTLPIVAGLVAILASAIFLQSIKVLMYKVSLAYTLALHKINPTENLWFQSIIDNKLTLGAIPLASEGHLEKISKHGVNAVLTTLEDFEMETPTFFSKPVTKSDWTKQQIDYKFIETPDFEPVPQEKIAEGVEWLKAEIDAGKHVYVHCKAGRGRSATIVICYLLKYGSNQGIELNTVDEAIAYVKSKREVIHMNPKQLQALYNYYNALTIWELK